MKLKKL